MDLQQFHAIRSRRKFFRECAGGIGTIALAQMLEREARGAAVEQNPLAPRKPHFAPKAKNVIFMFMEGGPSQIDLFDPKPELQKPLYFAPLLSCVVDQTTSPSSESKRTETRASFIVSTEACESADPATLALRPPAVPAITDEPSAWASCDVFSRAAPFKIRSAFSLFSVMMNRLLARRASITIACKLLLVLSSPKLST